MNIYETEKLKIAFTDTGAKDAPVIILLHGWPDDIHGWDALRPKLSAAGYRTITPYLRGFGETSFISNDTVRDGRGVALAQDVIDLADGLGLKSFYIAGHDWGARAGYILAALFPERITAIAALALAYQPKGKFTVTSFSQSRQFWYQWFMYIEECVSEIKADPIGFSLFQWETWSPKGWFKKEDFITTAQSFLNPDWIEITLNGYRSRFKEESKDIAYQHLQSKLESVEKLSVPTLMIQGGLDTCDEPALSDQQERYFLNGYKRILLNDVGHFPMRESPELVGEALIAHFKQYQ